MRTAFLAIFAATALTSALGCQRSERAIERQNRDEANRAQRTERKLDQVGEAAKQETVKAGHTIKRGARELKQDTQRVLEAADKKAGKEINESE